MNLNAYEVISQHCGKSIVSVYEENNTIVIQFNDNSHLILEDRGCNTCGGYRIVGTEDD